MKILYTYANSRPDDNLINDEIIKYRDYIYITATKALANERKSLIPDSQCTSDVQGKKPVALFADVIKLFLVENQYKVASKTAERTLFQRVVRDVFRNDPDLCTLFLKDIKSWLNILRDLASSDINLAQSNLPPELNENIIHLDMEVHLRLIQQAFEKELALNDLGLFESQAVSFFKSKFRGKPVVVMEGFTFLTKLQKKFISACERQDIEINFLVSYNDQQKKGFSIIDDTYPISEINRIHLNTGSISMVEDINHAQVSLFSEASTVYTKPLEGIRLISYPNRDREMLACIEQLREWFQGEYTPKDVVIVMRRSKEFIDRLRDHLAMNRLTYWITTENGVRIERDVQLSVPPRLLLLTPVGRFVLLIYEIWKDGELNMTASQFETILASGWLGPRLQDSASQFRAVKNQFFNHCVTKTNWEESLELTQENDNSLNRRIPKRLIKDFKKIVPQWYETIQMLNEVCERLFSTRQQSIGDHINKLLSELMGLFPKRLRDSEKEVIEQIQSAFEDLSSYYSIELTTSEFSETLHAMAQEREEEEDEADEEGLESDGKEESKLRVVTPETIDGLTKKAIIYVSVDSKHVPALYSETWPFYEDKREEHVIKERYMFLTVVRAAQEKLIITYAKKDGDRSFQPSVYINELEYIFCTQVDSKNILDQIDASKALQVPDFAEPPVTKYREYELDDLAHYGLCPLRYRLELLHPEAQVYRFEWQLQIVAQGVWLDLIFGRIFSEGMRLTIPKGSTDDKKIDLLFQYWVATQEVVKDEIKRLFPTFTITDWHAIGERVKGQLWFHANQRGKYHVSVIKGEDEEIEVLLPSGNNIIVNFSVPYYIKSGILTIPFLDGKLGQEWLIHGENSELDDKSRAPEKIIDDVMVFTDLYQAVSWWRRTIQSYVLDKYGVQKKNYYTDGLEAHRATVEEKLISWIQSIESNLFPKHVGGHCNECPVRMECLGIVEED